jgi:hypothetical protein
MSCCNKIAFPYSNLVRQHEMNVKWLGTVQIVDPYLWKCTWEGRMAYALTDQGIVDKCKNESHMEDSRFLQISKTKPRDNIGELGMIAMVLKQYTSERAFKVLVANGSKSLN